MTERSPRPRKRGRASDPEQTKADLVEAAFESLRTFGFRGTTARSIGALSGSNQAAIYYHFGGIEPLLLESLNRSSQKRLSRYQAELGGMTDFRTLVARLQSLYIEDTESGHMTVLAELMGGVTANPELVEGLEEAIRPWLEFVEAKIQEVASTNPLGVFVPAADLADLIFSLITGLELRNRLDGDAERASRLFRLAGLLASALPT